MTLKTLVPHVRGYDDSFLPWRMPSDSVWLTTDLQELRMVVELQSERAKRLAEAVVGVTHETLVGR
jgi:hypothetical protein